MTSKRQEALRKHCAIQTEIARIERAIARTKKEYLALTTRSAMLRTERDKVQEFLATK